MRGAGRRTGAGQNDYEKLGFRQITTFTFNPGRDSQNRPPPQFDDVREIQHQLKAQGVKLDLEADEKTPRPASLMITDPDGNPVLFDQHI